MSSRFIGNFENTISDGRLVLPAPFRKILIETSKHNNSNDDDSVNNENSDDTSKPEVVLTIGMDARYLSIFPMDHWNEMTEKLSAEGNDEVELYSDLLFNAVQLPVEKNGRIRIPQSSLDLLDLKNNNQSVVIFGYNKYIAIMTKEEFSRRKEEAIRNRINKGTKKDCIKG